MSSLFSSLLKDLEHLSPTKARAPVVVRAKLVDGRKRKEKPTDLYRRAMTGKGVMSAVELAKVINRSTTSVNNTMNRILIPRGYVVVGEPVPTVGSNRKTLTYKWVKE